MKHKVHDRNPLSGIGSFLIAFGILMAAVMMDIFNLGSPGEYVKWQILLMFIGVASLFNAKFGEALILFAVGFYFLIPHLDFYVPDYVDNFYWPAAIIIAGVLFILTGAIKKLRKN